MSLWWWPQRAVLHGGVECACDVALSAMLSVPLVAPLPSLAASVDTKSGRKRIFVVEEVNALPSIYDLFDQSLQILRSQQSRRMEVKLDYEVTGARGCSV
ncbi:uncharacterized protein MONOS_10873 [Monocercomonoides exilis]|uniref:uncharacterized protein n=1 Tax=Monocercomonoides exilis TaxID=2049356 RepID=UPI00355A46AE|nr:hypothetical protein MONOS_10873 [Monocercomonoides exilis]|eukprot:MONOS_10873.1-p1 / transcript=MONOS_10873.1 / gene=MONOS_10873 / organism=Monocercomonoides_exilis_PA203 / gene_product=unspecified product / transcript_product=unspecified product / location=Mono_scaffold00514:7921-8348(+) / protein_length=100 / sequence_SO=supercontig / SO=protein_coding / is_pseudo=false